MKKIVTVVLVATVLMVAGNQAHAQTKIGFISINELMAAMPEAKKADSNLAEYSTALNQNFEDNKKEFNEQDSLLGSKDTARFTRAQLELKRKNLVEMYQKLQAYQQQASQLYQAKREELIGPIQKKAIDATQTVAKESGYSYVFVKDALLVSPPADDILPLVKKKLGIK
jgi:outer membrane protein